MRIGVSALPYYILYYIPVPPSPDCNPPAPVADNQQQLVCMPPATAPDEDSDDDDDSDGDSDDDEN